MLVDVDGTSADVQQLAQIFAGAVKAAPQAAMIHAPLFAANLPGPSAVAQTANPQDGQATGEAGPVELLQPAAERVTAVPRTQNGKKKLRTPKLVSNLEFTSGDMPLKQFWNEHGDPTQDSKRYLVVAQWLKRYRSIEEVGADHVYTAYRAMNLTIPSDVLSVFRSLKRQAWVEAGSKKGSFRITHVGENRLNSDD